MTAATMQFDPYWLFRALLSGNVGQDISAPWFSPTLNLHYAGDPAVETQVVHGVASYGKQIGWLNEVVLALAQQATLPTTVLDTVGQMQDAAEHIETIKSWRRQDALATANASLERLRQEHPQAYEELLRAHHAARSKH